ncbi:MAG: molecular chaperone HtpG [Proteobacteria bacterium]|nr:molecular chaperone HtpG [Pseudomonadota bacterium]
MSSAKTVAFQAEVKQILDLVIHSLYSQKEIFLRELISNAYDATEKRRLVGLEEPELAYDGQAEIWLKTDKETQTLQISDRGIGMNRHEVETFIGTIAHSGTKSFAQKLTKIKENPELIGKFGVGFYSAFMVADKVELHTQKAGDTKGTFWVSSGDGSYTISSKKKSDGPGTTITLYLKKSEEEDYENYTDTWTIKRIVKKYSDFLDIPIKMMVEKTEPKLDKDGKPIEGESETKFEEETLNSMKALWRQPASKVKPEEYKEFYKTACKEWSDPLEIIHYKAEGSQEFVALLFVPSQVPFDYNHREVKWGPSLYIKKVFISERVSDLIPNYLRFIKGVVDSDDIPLNVSREILQKDHRLQALAKALQFKILKHFEKMLTKNRSDYEKIWDLWGATIKEGMASDFSQKENIEKISLFRTTLDNRWTTLDEYISRMKSDQKAIYYLTGESIAHLKDSPHMEKIREKSYEVLLLVDPVDDWVSSSLKEYDGKKVVSLTQDDLSFDGATSEEDEKKQKEDHDALDKDYQELKDVILGALSDELKEVKLSNRLVDSPVCLVSSTNDPTARMERMMGNLGQNLPKTKRILEINPHHAIIKKMKALPKEKQKTWADILYHQSLLNEGTPLKNPIAFTKKVNTLMTELSQVSPS